VITTCARNDCTVANVASHLLHRLLTLTSQLAKDSLITAAIVLEPLYQFTGIHFASHTLVITCTMFYISECMDNETRQLAIFSYDS